MAVDIKSDARFALLPFWARVYSVHTNKVKLVLFIILPLIIGNFFNPVIGGIGVVMMLAMGFRFIPSSPIPQAAIPQILEYRLPIPYRSGFTFVIPFLEKLLSIPVNDIDSDWTFEHVPTRRTSLLHKNTREYTKQMAKVLRTTGDVREPQYGGKVTFKVQYSLTPDDHDGWALIDILDKQGVEKALGFLKGIVGDDVRQIGRFLTWQQCLFATDLVGVRLIYDVTGTRTIETASGTVDVLEHPSRENIMRFVERIQNNGISDIRGSGFRVNTLSILSVVPEGKLAEEADRVTVEMVKRAQLSENVAALRENMEKLRGEKNPDGSITDEGALAALQAEDGTVTQTRQTYNVVNGEAMSKNIANALVQLLQGRN